MTHGLADVTNPDHVALDFFFKHQVEHVSERVVIIEFCCRVYREPADGLCSTTCCNHTSCIRCLIDRVCGNKRRVLQVRWRSNIVGPITSSETAAQYRSVAKRRSKANP